MLARAPVFVLLKPHSSESVVPLVVVAELPAWVVQPSSQPPPWPLVPLRQLLLAPSSLLLLLILPRPRA